MITEAEKTYAFAAIILELLFGTLVCCVSLVTLVGYYKLRSWEKPSGLIVINMLLADFMNGTVGPMQAAYLHCLLHEIKAPDLFRTIFFLQSWFLWISLLLIVLLNISRLIAIIIPFHYSTIVTMTSIQSMVAVFWITGFVYSMLKRYVDNFASYKYYVAGVIFHLVLDVMVFGLALLTLLFLRSPVSTEVSLHRINATKTVLYVSCAFFLSYGFYIYVNVVWMIPGLAENTTNEFLIFTAIGKWSLSLAHIFLLINSLFNGFMFGRQPHVRAAIENIWMSNYYRYNILTNHQGNQAVSIPTQ